MSNEQQVTQKDTIRKAAELMESGLAVFNHSHGSNDLTENCANFHRCYDASYACKPYGGSCFEVYRFTKKVGTYKTALGAAKKLFQINDRRTAFFAQNFISKEYTFLPDFPVWRNGF